MKRTIVFTTPRLNVLLEYRRWINTALLLLLMVIASVSLVNAQSGDFSGVIGNAKSKDKGKPTPLTSKKIVGVIDSESIGSSYYYSFMAGPGEIKVTLSVESGPLNGASSSLKSVSFTLFDRNESEIASRRVATSYGDAPRRAMASADLARRQRLVLGVTINEGFNKGVGRYELELDGAVDFGKDSSSSIDRTAQSAGAGDFSDQIAAGVGRNVTSLKGTKWAWVLPVDYGTGTLHCFYSFEDGQKVIRRVIAIAGDRLQLGIDNNRLLFYGTHTLTINHLPPAISVKERIGKYTQNGNSLTLEFSDSAVPRILTYDKDKGLWSDKTDPTFPKIYKISPAVN